MSNIRLQIEGSPELVEIALEPAGASNRDVFVVRCGDSRHEVEVVHTNGKGGWLRLHGRVVPYYAVRVDNRVEVWIAGQTYRLKIAERAARRAGADAAATADEIKAPMPGTVLKINIKSGETFEAHAPLIIMESMKMEMTLSAPHAGRIKQLQCEVGELVAMGQVLARLEQESSDASQTSKNR